MPDRPVTYVTWSSKPGGLEVLLKEYLGHFPSSRNVRLFLLAPSAPPLFFEPFFRQIFYGHRNRLLLLLKLFLFARNHRDDIFHVLNGGPFVLFALRCARARVLYHIHGTIYWKKSRQRWLRQLFWRLSYSPAHRYLANSEHSRAVFLRDACGRPEICVLHNGFRLEGVQPSPDKPPAPVRLFYAGRLAPGKNLELWLQTAAEIHRKRGDVRFHLYGFGPLESALKAQSHRLGLDGALTFEGYVSDIPRIYRENHLMLFLSGRESFGNVVVESLLYGTPALVSDIPSHRELLADHPEFILSRDGDPAAQVLSALDRYDALLHRAREASLAFRERFSFDRHAAALSFHYAALS